MSQDKKIVLVTGASRGIGQAIALELASPERYIIGTATTEAGANAITQYFTQAGVAGSGRVLNVADDNSINNLLTELTDTLASPLILVNNAAITRDNLLLRMDDQEWDDIIQTNLTSVFRLCRACIKGMFRERWGRIVNISSVVGVTGNSGQVNYAAAKAGIIGFSKSLAQEMASRNITVNVVAPGFIDTDMTQNLPEMVRQELQKRIPMKRLGKAKDIADAVNFLASDSASYITGQTLHVNGGMYMA